MIEETTLNLEDSQNSLRISQVISEVAFELPNTIEFKCPIHSQFKIDALCVDKNTEEIQFWCLKCILKNSLSNPQYDVQPIRDLFDRYLERPQLPNQEDIDEENTCKQKFIAMNADDYKTRYSNHLEKQFDVLNREVSKVIQELEKLREKFRRHIREKADELDMKSEEISKEVKKVLERSSKSSAQRFESFDHLYHHLEKLEGREEMDEFFRDVYERYLDKMYDMKSNGIRNISKMMDAFQDEVEELRKQNVDVTSLKRISLSVSSLLHSDKIFIKNRLTSSVLAKPRRVSILDIPQVSRSSSPSTKHNSSIYSSPLKTNFAVKQQGEEEDIYHTPTKKKYDFRRTLKKKKSTMVSYVKSQPLRKLRRAAQALCNGEKDWETSRSGVVKDVKDFIHRRVTAYLIYRNTLNDTESERRTFEEFTNSGVHLNQALGERWKRLPDDERQWYENFAKEERAKLSRQVEKCETYGDFEYLFQDLDRKVKKIKRE